MGSNRDVCIIRGNRICIWMLTRLSDNKDAGLMNKITLKEKIITGSILAVMLTLSAYTEQKPVIDTKPVATVDCSNEAVMGRCVLKIASVK